MGLCRHGNPEGNCTKCDREWNDAEILRLQEETLSELKKQNTKERRLDKSATTVIKKFCPYCKQYIDQPRPHETNKRKRFHRNYCPECGAKFKYISDGVNEWPLPS